MLSKDSLLEELAAVDLENTDHMAAYYILISFVARADHLIKEASAKSPPPQEKRPTKIVLYKAFGKTRQVVGECYNMESHEEPETIFMVCRPEEYYGIRPGIRTLVITEQEWRRGIDVD